MSEKAVLFAKILANPDDNAPRLAYAAWLDRHGDPILAEFIRVQIEEEKVSFLQRSDRGYQLWQINARLDGALQDGRVEIVAMHCASGGRGQRALRI